VFTDQVLSCSRLPQHETSCEKLIVLQPGPILPDSAFVAIEALIKTEIGDDYPDSSFSIEVTSNTDTLWTYHRSASVHDKDRPGVIEVAGDSQYRIASITKTFTVLALLYQHAAGNLSLDDSILSYLPELDGKWEGSLPLKDITIRSLASQLSGIPREFVFGDVGPGFPDPVSVGLPPLNFTSEPICQPENCTRHDLVKQLGSLQPLYAPNQKSTYSNLAFDLLGLAIETASEMDYSDYIISAIFEPLNMTHASLDKPSDERAVLPVGYNFWDVDEAVQRPTGGIYASSSDMSKYLRYVLTHYNALAMGVNWFMPASWSTGMNSFYGMPWEIARTDEVLEESGRPITLVTKSGGLVGYFSKIIMLPEYGLGITILTAGSGEILPQLADLVSVRIVQSAEAAAWNSVEVTHAGSYVSTDPALNSSISLSSSPSSGLVVSSFVSNGTDVIGSLLSLLAPQIIGSADTPWRAQLVPTMLYKNETSQAGETFRLVIAADRIEGREDDAWDDFCFTNEEYATYGGLPLNEVVFWHEEDIVEMPAWKLRAKKKEDRAEKVVMQEHRDL
jgi:CubicO group peptidase (beta-lactamase class C family)